MSNPPYDAFHNEINSVKELFNAKFDGVEKIVERLCIAVEKQIETNTIVAVLQNSHNNLSGNFREFKGVVGTKFADHDLRIGKVERTTASNTWRLNGAKAMWGAIGGGVTVVATFVVDHFDKIAAIVHGV